MIEFDRTCQRIASSEANRADDWRERYTGILERIEAVQDILACAMTGKDSIAGGCRRYGYDYLTFMRRVDDIASVDSGKIKPVRLPKYEPDGTEYLYSRVFGCEAEEVFLFAPSDADETVEWALDSMLSERNAGIVRRVIEGESLEVIGRTFGISRERVRQISEKAFHVMKRPAVAEILLIGVGAAKEEADKVASEFRAEEERREAELAERRERYRNHVINMSVQPLSVLDLSVRSYNALRRAGVDNVGQLIQISKWDFEHINYLGKKSMAEIIDSMHSNGLFMSWETREEVA